jgi:hypothetical protein
MKTKIMVFVLIGLVVVIPSIISLFSVTVADYLGYSIYFASSLWVAIDSSKMQLKRYKSGISYGPATLFIGCILLWLVAVPWYLWMRYQIESGRAVLKS